MSVFGVILVRIFPHSDWKICISPYSVLVWEDTDQNNSEYRYFSRSEDFRPCSMPYYLNIYLFDKFLGLLLVPNSSSTANSWKKVFFLSNPHKIYFCITIVLLNLPNFSQGLMSEVQEKRRTIFWTITPCQKIITSWRPLQNVVDLWSMKMFGFADIKSFFRKYFKGDLLRNEQRNWVKVFKNRPSKTCGRQPSKHLERYDLLKQSISLQIFWKLSPRNFSWSILEYFVPYNHFKTILHIVTFVIRNYRANVKTIMRKHEKYRLHVYPNWI